MKIQIILITAFSAAILLFSIRCGRDYNNPVDPKSDRAIPPTPRNLELFAVQGQAKVQGRFSYTYQNNASLVYERSLLGQAAFLPIDTLGNDTTFIDSIGLAYDTVYEYRLCGINANGRSNYSPAKDIRTSRAPDITGPTIQMLNPPHDSFVVAVDTFMVMLKASDVSGVCSVTVQGVAAAYDSAGDQYFRTLRLSPNINNFTVIAYDRIGNVTTVQFDSVFFDSTMFDKNGPYITVISHKNIDTVVHSTVTLQMAVIDPSSVRYVTVDGYGAIPKGVSGWEYVLSGLVPNESREVIIEAGDNSTRRNTSHVILGLFYNYDTVPPVVSITQPAAESLYTVTDTVNLSGIWSDASRIASITVDSLPASVSPGTWSRKFKVLSPGNWIKVTVTATDSSPQNNRDTAVCWLYWDSTYNDHIQPAITRDAAIIPDTVGDSVISLRGKASDHNGIFAVTVNGSPAGYSKSDSNWTLSNFALNRPVSGRFALTNIRVIATDNSFNRNRDTLDFTIVFDSTRVVKGDVSGPAFTVKWSTTNTNQPDLDTVFSDTFTLGGDVNDPSGVDSFGVRINNGAWINLGKSTWSHQFTQSEFRNKFIFYARDSVGNVRRDTIVCLWDYPNVVHQVKFDSAAGAIRVSWSRYTEKDYRNVRIWVTEDYYADTASATWVSPVIVTDTFMVYPPPDRDKVYTFIVGIVDSLKQTALRKFTRSYSVKAPLGMAVIPAGTFQMGEAGVADAEPVHSVALSGFWMDSTEVTQRDFVEVTGAQIHFGYAGQTSMDPIIMMSWADAALYCNARSKRDGLDTVYQYTMVHASSQNWYFDADGLIGLVIDTSVDGYRLPTEAEWEYACRGSTTGSYYWGGSAADGYAWYSGNSGFALHPVEGRTRNLFGLYDMGGNVFEWCNDVYGTPYDAAAQTDPLGPPDAGRGSGHVLRGGDYTTNAGGIGSASRFQEPLQPYPSDKWGFRVVRRRR